MKTFVLAITLLVAAVGVPVTGQAPRDQTLTGVITDTMCAESHKANIEHARENSGKTMTEKECTNGCVARRGQKYVFVSGNKIYQIANQTFGDLVTYAAETVTLTGKVAGETLTVSRIAPTTQRSK